MRFPGLLFIASGIGIAVILAAETNSPPIVVKNQGFLPFADAPINYRSADVDDPIARLEKRLEKGEVSLNYEPQHGYLRSVLDALQVPVNSQTLVFAKTSFQFPQINPEHPRALYYNNDVYVGQVYKGKFLEFVSFDPRQGPVFYVMDERQSEHPRFERSALDCVQCHVAKTTRGVPGVMLRSVFAKPDGSLAAGAKSFVTGQESPFNERWGGWYVTAMKGGETGFANATVSDLQRPEQVAKPADVNLTSLRGKFDTTAYLTGSSDIVALLVLAHQTQMHNLITETSYRTRLAFYAEQQKSKAAAIPGDVPSTISDKTRSQIEALAEQLVQYLLFANEAPLETPAEGNTAFAKDFAARGPFDSKGRSLRQFDLRTRIFKYPCSYLIYSEGFDALPEFDKEYVYRRLFEVLSGKDQTPAFRNLSPESRRAILEILTETKPGLPEEWKQFVQQAKP
jgi:hypothetical protein